MKKVTRQITALILGLALAAGLFVAFPGSVQAAAKKKTVYVIDRIDSKVQDEDLARPEKTKATFQYNANGLLKQYGQNGEVIGKFSFDGKGRYKALKVDSKDTYKYDKKGRITKFTYGNVTYAVKYSGGRLKSIGGKKVTYDKKGRVTKIWSLGIDGWNQYKYGSKGDLSKYIFESEDDSVESSTDTFKFKYKNGSAASVVMTSSDGTTTTAAFHYKKVRVPADRVDQVKAQQSWIKNNFYTERLILLPVRAQV